MKKLILLVLISIFLVSCGERTVYITDTKAKVLSINQRLLDGKLIGDFFLFSGEIEGYIRQKNTVGLEIDIKDKYPLLIDVDMSFSELAYFKDSDKIPVKIYLATFYEKHGSGTTRAQWIKIVSNGNILLKEECGCNGSFDDEKDYKIKANIDRLFKTRNKWAKKEVVCESVIDKKQRRKINTCEDL